MGSHSSRGWHGLSRGESIFAGFLLGYLAFSYCVSRHQPLYLLHVSSCMCRKYFLPVWQIFNLAREAFCSAGILSDEIHQHFLLRLLGFVSCAFLTPGL